MIDADNLTRAAHAIMMACREQMASRMPPEQAQGYAFEEYWGREWSLRQADYLAQAAAAFQAAGFDVEPTAQAARPDRPERQSGRSGLAPGL